MIGTEEEKEERAKTVHHFSKTEGERGAE